LAQPIPDGTLGVESSVVTPKVINGIPSDQIDGGAIRGANLFHSFEQFSVITGHTAYFNNTPDIKNIISRVTGGAVSNIDGSIRTNGTANVFLLNPNGIIFGPNASLDIRGSFLASTASSLDFADGTQFSATAPQTTPLLTVSVPIGLQFGTAAGSIRNQSRATNSGVVVGVQVQPGKTLALVGGDVTLEGGYLTAEEGRIELGSVAGSSLVSLIPTDQGLGLGYEGIQNFQDIQLSQGAIVSASGSGGIIQVQGRRVMLTDFSQILATNQGAERGGNLTVTASESVELIGNDSVLISATDAAGDGGDITINTGRLLIRDGAFVLTSSSEYVDSSRQLTSATGKAGNLTVEASESVELTNGSIQSETLGSGDAGNVTINTERLLVRGDEAEVTVSSEGTGNAGNLTVKARSILLDDKGTLTAETTSGGGGNITLQAGDVRLRRESKISTTAGTQGNPGDGGHIIINTDTLVGLENSDITANAFEGKGGTINITAQGIFGLVQRDLEDLKTLLGSDGLNKLDPLDLQQLPSSDITAISQTDPSLRGQVTINRPDVDPSQGLVNLPEEVVDVSGLVAQGCSAGGGKADRGLSEFIVTGRGGLPPTPRETLSSDTVLEDWGTLALTSAQPPRPRQHDARENRSGSPAVSTHPTRPTPAPLVEATGWVIGAKGEVILTATAPTTTPHSPWLPPATCHAP
jgi:filamentous hemagglutinin family protein